MRIRYILFVVFLLTLKISFASQFLGVDATICKNNTVIIHDMIVKESWADYEYDESNYSIIIDSKTGKLLDFNIPVSFITFVDYTDSAEIIELDCINTIVKVPYYKGMETMSLENKDKTIKQVNIEDFLCKDDKECNSYCFERNYDFCSEEELNEIERYINDSCGNGLCEPYLGEDDFNCESDCVFAGKDNECVREEDGICDVDCATVEDPDCALIEEKKSSYSKDIFDNVDSRETSEIYNYNEGSNIKGSEEESSDFNKEEANKTQKKRPRSETPLYILFFVLMVSFFIGIVFFIKRANNSQIYDP